METTSVAWHKMPGNKEKQIKTIMEPVLLFINDSAAKYVSSSSQGFDLDRDAAVAFIQIITDELSKLGLEGEHDLHQSSTGSGKWYYKLKGVWHINSSGVFSSFSETCSFARQNSGKVIRCGDKQWKVIL
ncbi:hypothetical protein [Photobacterium sanguinicancri]|uniref:hypothetical protein n=1 Tax=Photobacterium sanguinicancri TaxID=875932 RepID=UPI000786C28B|nr:hypothetical protein [Photobacterium sanguinicancri]KXI21750.1 hypothetical protein AS132_19110 [Photobacterium sanguinicancri]